MYCPYCFNDSLVLNKSGIVDIVINDKKLDNGRFLFNTNQESEDEIEEHLEQKVKEFFQWYSHLKNVGPVKKLQIVSNNFSCSSGCHIKANDKFSVVDQLFSKSVVEKIAKEAAKHSKVHIKLEKIE